MTLALLCLGLVAVLPDAHPVDSADPKAAYREIRAQTGRSADEQVRLALWCEARGLDAERLTHLAAAVLADPEHATARGLLGLVTYGGRFQRPEAVATRAAADPLLAEYAARRAKTAITAEGQWALAAWADQHGLRDQAEAHFLAVTRLDPRRNDAWKRLGYRRHDGRWLTEVEYRSEQAASEAQRQADRHWRPVLGDWRRQLASPSRRAGAESGLAGVDDPLAVPSILRVFATNGPDQPRAVQLLGQVAAPAASRALAILALTAKSASARQAATETLRARDPREYVDLWIGLLGEPIRFEVKPAAGPNGPGELLVEGAQANLRRVYIPPSPLRPGDQLGVDDSGRPVVLRRIEPGGMARINLGFINKSPFFRNGSVTTDSFANQREIDTAFRLLAPDSSLPPVRSWFYIRYGDLAEIPVGQIEIEAQKSRAETEQQLRFDVWRLENHNQDIRSANDRVSTVLNAATGLGLAADRRAWTRWYHDKFGNGSSALEWTSRVAVTEAATIAYQPPVLPENSVRQIADYTLVVDCFVAGTPVQTLAGPRPIESLAVGDRVLTQNPTTGALGYHPVLATHANPAMPTCRIQLRNGAVDVASPGHGYWVAGKGWVMARDLKPGDPVRTLGGVAPVETVETDAPRPVFNLDVAGNADYFAGSARALVHDNTPPDFHLDPFDGARRPVALKAH